MAAPSRAGSERGSITTNSKDLGANGGTTYVLNNKRDAKYVAEDAAEL